jgi:hypothetical protein
MEKVCFSQTLASTDESNGAKTQKKIIIILTAVKTSNSLCLFMKIYLH